MAVKSISINEELIVQIENLAQEESRNFSNMVEVLLKRGLEATEK